MIKIESKPNFTATQFSWWIVLINLKAPCKHNELTDLEMIEKLSVNLTIAWTWLFFNPQQTLFKHQCNNSCCSRASVGVEIKDFLLFSFRFFSFTSTLMMMTTRGSWSSSDWRLMSAPQYASFLLERTWPNTSQRVLTSEARASRSSYRRCSMAKSR